MLFPHGDCRLSKIANASLRFALLLLDRHAGLLLGLIALAADNLVVALLLRPDPLLGPLDALDPVPLDADVLALGADLVLPAPVADLTLPNVMVLALIVINVWTYRMLTRIYPCPAKSESISSSIMASILRTFRARLNLIMRPDCLWMMWEVSRPDFESWSKVTLYP